MYASRSLLLAATLAGAGFAARAPVASAAQAQSAPELSVVRHGAQTELALAGQAPFHRTGARVHQARSIALPGSQGIVATWSETGADGAVTPWYAISSDGRGFATVRPTSYHIGMELASFDPLLSVPDLSTPGLAWDGQVYLVQFVSQVLAEYRSALEELGARTYDHIVNHTLIVRMDPVVRDQVEQLEFVRWIGPFQPALRMEPGLRAALASGELEQNRVYNLMVFERGLEQKELVAGVIASMGGVVRELSPSGFRLVAELSPSQVASLLSLPEIAGIDPWGPPEVDLNIVRQFSGADYLQTQTGFGGQGVRGEVMDTGCDVNHPDFQHDGGVLIHTANNPSTSHGTQVTGIVFGNGTGNPTWKGIMPNGKIVFAAYTVLGDRYAHTAQLVNPALPYQCVFQTNSWGNPQTSSYTSISAEMDDILFINDILITQSQSNTGSTLSRPEAWAKNIVSIGGINHNNTLTKNDDSWGGASIGPATDGRLKPDLAHFYDNVTAPAAGGGYGVFSGTSCATPCTIGHFGLFFQMWHNNIWNNGASGATVFDSRPHAMLAKAALINTAGQWTFSGTNHNLTRTHQGWGYADMQKLYDTRNNTIFVNQTDILDNLATKTYVVNVAAGAPELKVTMVYRDPKAVVFTGLHRINDLTLRVTAPNSTIYWGNNGLNAGLWSTSGGVANNKDTVEKVFIQNPAAGNWTVDVIGSDINTDIVPGTAGNNADFALWITGVAATPCVTPPVYCTAKLTSGGSLPAIGSTGSPSIVTQNFVVTLSGAMPSSTSNVFWGGAPAATPFAGGFLCVAPPVTRGPASSTSPAGADSFPVTITPLMVGQTLYYQWWFRDVNSVPDPLGLSNALEVTFCNS